MKLRYFVLCCISILSYLPISSQIVNQGTFNISSSTTVFFGASYTNKATGTHISNGDLNLKGDFINNGITTSNSGTTLFNNANSEIQYISGTTGEVKFYNLTIDNISGVSQNSDLIVNGNLLINSGKSLSVSPSKKLTVTGSISNLAGNTGFVLKSDSIGTASLLHNTANVPATVERYISGAVEDWHFLSSPVTNQTIAGSNWVPAGTYGNGTGYDLYVWDEPKFCWVYQLNNITIPDWPTAHPQTNFISGRGYLYSVQALNPTNIFTGPLNNGPVSYPLTANNTVDPLLTGFNLIGNPYASAIDWKASAGWTRSNLLDSGGGYDMWIWNPIANNYGVFNSIGTTGTNDVTPHIASMQGFFVRAESNANITMTNTIRSHTGASNWKNSTHVNTLTSIKVKIASNSGYGFDEVLLQFGHTSNEAGAAKLFSSSKMAPSVYTTMDNEKLSVKYLTNTIDNPFVPIHFMPGNNGDFKFNIDINNGHFEYLILEDKITKTFQNLLKKPEYSFSSSVEDYADRFILHFKDKNSISEENNLVVPIYYDGEYIVVDLSLIPNYTAVEIFDILGKRMLNQSLEGERIHYLPVRSHSVLYIVIAKNLNKITRKKVLVY